MLRYKFHSHGQNNCCPSESHRKIPRGTALSEHENGQLMDYRRDMWTIESITDELGRIKAVFMSFLVNPESFGTKKITGRSKV